MLFTKLGELIKKHYKFVLVVSVLFTVLSVYWMSKLKMSTQLSDMLPADEPEVIAYENAMENFSGIDAIGIVIEGEERNIISYIEDIRHKIKDIPDIGRITYKTEDEFIRKNGLLLVKERELKNLKGMLTASSLRDFIGGLNDNFEMEYIESEEDNKIKNNSMQLLSMFNTIEDFLNLLKDSNPKTSEINEVSDKFLIGPKYMISPDRSIGIMFARSPLKITDMEKIIPLVNTLEGIVKENQEKHNVKAGLSGFLVLQRDEMAASQKDMSTSFIVALLLIIIIFILGFRLIRYTVLAIIPLIVGIIWAMGLTYVIYGKLNLFTAMMGAILIGLGIDYAIHIISLYTEERQKGTSINEAITMVFKKTIKGVVTGSVTTAIGFTMFSISSFPGFQEFGIVLGLGIICTLTASVFILPSLFMIFGRKDVKKEGSPSKISRYFSDFILFRPWYIVVFIMLLVILSIARFRDVKFSVDLKDIEPKGLESLEMNDKLIEKFDFSNDMTLGVTKTLKETHRLKKLTDDLNTIGAVESIADYVPLSGEQKNRRAALKVIKKSVSPGVSESLHMNELVSELERLEDNIIEISDLSYMGGEKKIVDKCDALVDSKIIASVIERIKDNKGPLERTQNIFIKNVKEFVLHSNSKTEINIEDLPESIKNAHIGKDGTFLTTIYPEGDVWSGDFQPLYVNEINSLNMALTGTSLLNLKIMEIAAAEGKKILIMVLFAIFIVLLIDFRSLKYATLAMIPMVLTLVLLVGVMAWFRIDFNFVNIIALPIIIGIGVDDGVHLIHRYLIEGKLFPTIKSVGRSVLLTTLTTMSAFGTMMIGTYQGLASFGLVLTIGIAWAYILTILFLSALLKITDNK